MATSKEYQQQLATSVREGASVNQLVATALAEKLAALAAEDYLQQRTARGNRQQFEVALAQVPVDLTMNGDELTR